MQSNKGKRKVNAKLFVITPTYDIMEIGSKFTVPFLKNNVVVFDGDNSGNSSTVMVVRDRIANTSVVCTKIIDGGLKICHPPIGKKGTNITQ